MIKWFKKAGNQIRQHPLEAVSAIASMAAVIAALAAQQSAENLSKAALRPHLDITQRIKPSFGLRVDNAGQGAAIIENFDIYVNGERPPSHIAGNEYRSALVESGLAKLNSDGQDVGTATITTVDTGIAIMAGTSFYIYEWDDWNEQTPPPVEMQSSLNKIDIRIVYKSLAGDRYCVLYQGGDLATYTRDRGNSCKP